MTGREIPDLTVEQIRRAKALFDSAEPVNDVARWMALPVPLEFVLRGLRVDRMRRAREATGWSPVEVWRLEEAGLLWLLPCQDPGDDLPLVRGALGYFNGLMFVDDRRPA